SVFSVGSILGAGSVFGAAAAFGALAGSAFAAGAAGFCAGESGFAESGLRGTVFSRSAMRSPFLCGHLTRRVYGSLATRDRKVGLDQLAAEGGRPLARLAICT